MARRHKEKQRSKESSDLIEQHLWLVRSVARRYRWRPGVEIDDLIQEGCLGLLRAHESFQPARSVRFATYAGYWVDAYMRRHALRRREWLYAVPAHARDPARVARRVAAGPCARLDASAGSAGDQTLLDTLSSEESSPAEWVAARQLQAELLRAIAAVLTELRDWRADRLVAMRFFSEAPVALGEVGRHIRLSHEGARLLERKILARLSLLLPHRSVVSAASLAVA